MSRLVRKATKISTAALSVLVDKQHLIRDTSYSFTVQKATELSLTLQEAIWNLFRRNMEDWYKTSDVFDWDPSEKRSELFDDASRFLLVTLRSAQPEEDLVAYSMFRFDLEENMEGKEEPVLYCYELQVSKKHQGGGLGKALLENLERFGRQWCMRKIMLTVLTVNIDAVRFYQREGFVTDAISPDDEGYMILSKILSTHS